MRSSNGRFTIDTPLGLFILGTVALAVGLGMAQRTSRFVTRAVPASCTVDSTSRYSFSVWCAGQDGVKNYVMVRRPWLTAPFAYSRGQKVAILHEPDALGGDFDPFTMIFSGPPARVNSTLHIWTSAALVLAAGLGLWGLAAAASGGRFRAAVNLEVGRNLS